ESPPPAKSGYRHFEGRVASGGYRSHGPYCQNEDDDEHDGRDHRPDRLDPQIAKDDRRWRSIRPAPKGERGVDQNAFDADKNGTGDREHHPEERDDVRRL